MKTIVIHHSADYDGIFCREIARKFLPEAELIGWDYGDPIPSLPPVVNGRNDGVQLYMLDISIPALMSHWNLIWIDHHKSAIEKFATDIPGYRIDGVAACRLAWQWFTHDIAVRIMGDPAYLPRKDEYLDRSVSEPLAVRLAGEYDIWDHRGDGDVHFQFGLDAQPCIFWDDLLDLSDCAKDETIKIIQDGHAAMQCYAKRDADVMRSRSFLVYFEGVRFLALNTARCNSNTFSARDVPETGHDGLLAFFWTGKEFSVSLYHAAHRKDLDLSLIAVKHGGGGHRGACGFRTDKLPFLP